MRRDLMANLLKNKDFGVVKAKVQKDKSPATRAIYLFGLLIEIDYDLYHIQSIHSENQTVACHSSFRTSELLI
jgi:hypothetical protein